MQEPQSVFTICGVGRYPEGTTVVCQLDDDPRPKLVHVGITIICKEYTQSLSACVFGFDVVSFIKEAEEVVGGRAKRACLQQEGNSFSLEFQHLDDGQDFLSIHKKWLMPLWDMQSPTLKSLRAESEREIARNKSAQFTVSYIPIENQLGEFTEFMRAFIEGRHIDTSDPYI